MYTWSESKIDLNETHTTWNMKIFLLLFFGRKVSFLISLNSQIYCATRCCLVFPFPTCPLPARHYISLSSFPVPRTFFSFSLLCSLILLELPCRSWSFPRPSRGPFMPHSLPEWSHFVLIAPTTIFWPMNPLSELPHQSFLYSLNPCNCLQEISPWISYRHFKFNMSKLNSSSPHMGSLMAFPISGNGNTLHPVNQARNLWFIPNSSHFPHCLNPINHQVLFILFSKSLSFKFILLWVKRNVFCFVTQPVCMCMLTRARAHTQVKHKFHKAIFIIILCKGFWHFLLCLLLLLLFKMLVTNGWLSNG